MTPTTGNASGPIIVWFRDDLRLADHAPLTDALLSGHEVIACYVLDEAAGALGGAGRWWLHRSLASLARDIEEHGGALVLKRGDAAEEIAALAADTAAVAVHCHRSYEPLGRRCERRLEARLRRTNVRLVVHPGRLLFEPEAVATRSGEPFKVFTPFWRACLAAPHPPAELPVPDAAAFHAMRGAAVRIETERLEDWRLLPSASERARGFAAVWHPGEAQAHERLEGFVEGRLDRYAEKRDRPDVDGTSRLSPHLRFGEISPRAVWHRVRAYAAADASAARGAGAFLRELGWREFASHLLWHFPDLPETSFRRAFEAFPWSDDRRGIESWQRGATGYPVVDAGMRELWQTGWMHNRVRMLAASFLCKDLMVAWQQGADWFLDTLVDADVASNSVNWQWVAGSGVDAAPYFRVFNPALQGRKFDPEGAYVRRWVPELAKLATRHIHAPDRAPAAELAAAGVELGKSYPQPIVDHAAARQRALAAYRVLMGRG